MPLELTRYLEIFELSNGVLWELARSPARNYSVDQQARATFECSSVQLELSHLLTFVRFKRSGLFLIASAGIN